MKRTQQVMTWVGAVAATALLVGCGTGGTSEPDGSTGSQTPTAQPDPDSDSE